jgi:hypothetical protein
MNGITIFSFTNIETDFILYLKRISIFQDKIGHSLQLACEKRNKNQEIRRKKNIGDKENRFP